MKFLKPASQSTVDERLSHCTPCEHNKLGICKRCGCFVQGKARLAGSVCPIGLWGREENWNAGKESEPQMAQEPPKPSELGIKSLFPR
jgi:hypothetical protein